jgi:glucose/mannose-6-phosphate isomerase
MTSLDSIDEVKKIDSNNVAGSIQAFDDQLNSAWEEMKSVDIPTEYRNVKNIVVSGMGASALGAHFVRRVYDLSLPLQIVNNYALPAFVNSDTLLIVSSYSGNTEETLSTFADGQKKSAKIFGISTGGKLVEELKNARLPFYQFDPKFNPSGQPRMGLGYSIGALLGFFTKLGFLNISDGDIEKVLNSIKKVQFGLEVPKEKNQAKTVAAALHGKIPVIFAAEFLVGNAHIFANQINENAKSFATYFKVPEANHHLLEGISFPDKLKEIAKFVFLETENYDSKIQKRFAVTKDLLAKKGLEYVTYKLSGVERQTDAFEAIIFSSWISFYLAVLYETNPGPIPNVDFFKDQLSKFA